jgi:hypothetical protein
MYNKSLGMALEIGDRFGETTSCTIAVDTVGIVLAAIGIVGPPPAAFIHVTSELAFILNSARLLPRPEGAMRAREPSSDAYAASKLSRVRAAVD